METVLNQNGSCVLGINASMGASDEKNVIPLHSTALVCIGSHQLPEVILTLYLYKKFIKKMDITA